MAKTEPGVLTIGTMGFKAPTVHVWTLVTADGGTRYSWPYRTEVGMLGNCVLTFGRALKDPKRLTVEGDEETLENLNKEYDRIFGKVDSCE